MKNLLLLLTTTVSLVAAITPTKVELNIYSNKAFLSKSYDLNQSSEVTTKIPQDITIEKIRYSLEEGCVVDSNTITKPKNKENIQKIQELTNRIKALKAKENLLKTISLKDIQQSEEVESISNLLVDKLTQNMAEIEYLKQQLIELDKKSKIKNSILKIAFTCDRDTRKVKILYPINIIKYTPFYNISANINNKSVTIEKEATLIYKGVENYDNIDLNIYSYRYNQDVAPQPFYPKYLEEKKVLYAKNMLAMDSIQKSSPRKIMVKYQELATKSFYKIKNISLKKDERNLIHIDKTMLDASFKNIIDAYGSNKAYLQATIKTKKNYSSAQANYFLNQNPIATRYMDKVKKGQPTQLYFGENEHIQITKRLIKTLNEKTFFRDKKVSTQNWKYTIINKKPYSTDVEFITRVPVSKDANIKVKTLALPKFDSQSAQGKTIWNLKLQPNNKTEIIFGYEISKSN
jgi:hypothetical protein